MEGDIWIYFNTKVPFHTGKGAFNTYLRWRAKYPNAQGFTADELEQLHQRTRVQHETRSAAWD